MQPLPPAWDAERDEALTCVAVRAETHDVSTFVFAPVEPRLFRFLAGQFMTFDLPAAGDLDGAGVQRSYTIASPPTRPWRIEVTAKRSPGGAGSGWLHGAMRPGVQVRASGPMGDFVLDPQSGGRQAGGPQSGGPQAGGRYLFLSAGSGITPVMSMARTLHDMGSDADVLFLHSARSPADLLFPEELAVMARRPGFRAVNIVEADAPGARWDGLRGRLSPAMLGLLAPDLLQREVFCCGPAPYMAAVRAMLDAAGFDRARYQEESFSFGDGAALPDGTQTVAEAPSPEPSGAGEPRGAARLDGGSGGPWIATPQAARNDGVMRVDGAGRAAASIAPAPRIEQPSSRGAERRGNPGAAGTKVDAAAVKGGLLLPLPPGEGRGEGKAARANFADQDGSSTATAGIAPLGLPHPGPLPEGEGAGSSRTSSPQAARDDGVPAQHDPGLTTFTVRFARQDRDIACPGGASVLAAARAAGVRLPSACGKGVCGTCKSRVLSGTVEMRHGGGIRQREINDGMALLCCARPTSDLVVDR
jgi:ferredoxin-NADP reductase/ferredoxin